MTTPETEEALARAAREYLVRVAAHVVAALEGTPEDEARRRVMALMPSDEHAAAIEAGVMALAEKRP